MSAPTTVQWIRQAGQRIATGSTRRTAQLAAGTLRLARNLWRRAAGWLGEASGLSWVLRVAVLLAAAVVVRKVAVAVAGAVYARVESGQAWWLLWGAAIGWTVTAYRAGREGWKPKQPAPAAEPAPVEEPPAEPSGPRPPTAAELVAAVREIGTPHAHLKALASHLQTTTEQVRETAAVAGLAVTDVRMGGRPSTGVRGDALPSLPSPDPTGGVVGAGQPANNDNNNAFESVPDEDNPHRTHVHWLTK
ncbi:hypothetical protein [Streptomyces bobili]|uniref:hypothetical protein n=1 Tax=Streptomyces bobili TaxID=67280 RepID=UPI000A3BD842|nr:hypothetical protein [Streptomyces bobili]